MIVARQPIESTSWLNTPNGESIDVESLKGEFAFDREPANVKDGAERLGVGRIAATAIGFSRRCESHVRYILVGGGEGTITYTDGKVDKTHTISSPPPCTR